MSYMNVNDSNEFLNYLLGTPSDPRIAYAVKLDSASGKRLDLNIVQLGFVEVLTDMLSFSGCKDFQLIGERDNRMLPFTNYEEIGLLEKSLEGVDLLLAIDQETEGLAEHAGKYQVPRIITSSEINELGPYELKETVQFRRGSQLFVYNLSA